MEKKIEGKSWKRLDAEEVMETEIELEKSKNEEPNKKITTDSKKVLVN